MADRLYAESDVRAMLVEAVEQAAQVSGQSVASFVYAEIVDRILSTPSPVGMAEQASSLRSEAAKARALAEEKRRG